MSSRESCNDCGSSRGLASYDDGSYCFSCSKYTPHKSLIKNDKKDKTLQIELPEEDRSEWREDAYDWLSKYQDEESKSIMKYCFWSEKYKRIVFPQYIGNERDGMKMIAAWMRRVEDTVRPEYNPKWLFAGYNDTIFKYGEYNNGSVCLVEDVVSAVKVSQVMDCIALGGTILKENVYSHIGMSGYSKVYIFLDPDQAGRNGAEKIRKRLALLTESVIIRGKKDPKELPIVALEELLGC